MRIKNFMQTISFLPALRLVFRPTRIENFVSGLFDRYPFHMEEEVLRQRTTPPVLPSPGVGVRNFHTARPVAGGAGADNEEEENSIARAMVAEGRFGYDPFLAEELSEADKFNAAIQMRRALLEYLRGDETQYVTVRDAAYALGINHSNFEKYLSHLKESKKIVSRIEGAAPEDDTPDILEIISAILNNQTKIPEEVLDALGVSREDFNKKLSDIYEKRVSAEDEEILNIYIVVIGLWIGDIMEGIFHLFMSFEVSDLSLTGLHNFLDFHDGLE